MAASPLSIPSAHRYRGGLLAVEGNRRLVVVSLRVTDISDPLDGAIDLAGLMC